MPSLDINKNEFIRIIERSIKFKRESQKNILNNSLQNKTMTSEFSNATEKVDDIRKDLAEKSP